MIADNDIITVNNLLNIPPIISRFLWMFASLSRERVDVFVNMMFYNMLIKLLSGGRAAVVVKLLHAKIVGGDYAKDFPLQGKSRNEYYDTAREGLYSLLPWWLPFSKSWNKLMDSLLDSLQYAPLNKHLAYFLLDHLLVNLFPEVTT